MFPLVRLGPFLLQTAGLVLLLSLLARLRPGRT